MILILIDLTEKQPRAGAAKTLNEQLRSQRANIDALSSAYATQRKMTHDFRHHIAALSGMLQEARHNRHRTILPLCRSSRLSVP